MSAVYYIVHCIVFRAITNVRKYSYPLILNEIILMCLGFSLIIVIAVRLIGEYGTIVIL